MSLDFSSQKGNDNTQHKSNDVTKGASSFIESFSDIIVSDNVMNTGIDLKEYRRNYNIQLNKDKNDGNKNMCDKDGNKITIGKKKSGGKNFYWAHFTQWLNSHSSEKYILM